MTRSDNCIQPSALVCLDTSHSDRTAFDTIMCSYHTTATSLTEPSTLYGQPTNYQFLRQIMTMI